MSYGDPPAKYLNAQANRTSLSILPFRTSLYRIRIMDEVQGCSRSSTGGKYLSITLIAGYQHYNCLRSERYEICGYDGSLNGKNESRFWESAFYVTGNILQWTNMGRAKFFSFFLLNLICNLPSDFYRIHNE
jgi:hypothetical protein